MEPDRDTQRHDERPGRSERDREALEARRRRAAEMFRRGERQADVARALRVSAQSVSRWYRDWSRGGMRPLRRAKRAGRPPRLTGVQLRRLSGPCSKGPWPTATPRTCGRFSGWVR
jgi:transposase